MKPIKFNGYNNGPIVIDVEKIMAVEEISTTPPVTKLIMQTGNASEDWIICELANDVLAKIMESNKTVAAQPNSDSPTSSRISK